MLQNCYKCYKSVTRAIRPSATRLPAHPRRVYARVGELRSCELESSIYAREHELRAASAGAICATTKKGDCPMKTLKISLIATIVTALLIIACGATIASAEEMYPMTAKVVNVDYTTDTVTVENFNGFLYAFFGCEDWQVGDCCSLIMGDNGTESIYDDIIMMAHYSGWELVDWRN